MKYTLNANGSQAHTVTGRQIAIVPDEVAANQKGFNGKNFPILVCGAYPYGGEWRRSRGTLRGDYYGLNTPGTGDMVVAVGNRKSI